MSDPSDPRSWLAKADNDLLNIENNLRAADVPWDTVCFHAQQAAEKALKAVLAAGSQPIERTHDLESLLNDCVAAGRSLEALRVEVVLLNPYSVASRYPDIGPDPDSEQGRAAAAAASRIVAAVRLMLAV